METPANLLTPRLFADAIQKELTADFNNISSAQNVIPNVNIHGADWIKSHSLGGLINVGKGSYEEVVFVEIEYKGNPKQDDHIALVGKGVTFDAGGISLKPSQGMDLMRGDMGGAAVVAATIAGLSRLSVPINVRGYLPLCENLPGGKSIKPGDVIKMANGLTVQVDNTDAEGRLILADALYLACNPALFGKASNPLLVIDAATLTGAILSALGDRFTGLFVNEPAKRCFFDTHLEKAGKLSGDRFWQLPLDGSWPMSGSHIEGGCHLADLNNILVGSYAKHAGSSSAAQFLQNFVNKDVPWIHLDIAGVMTSPKGYLRSGMTGRPVRPLIAFIETIASSLGKSS